MPEFVILVDRSDREAGTEEKIKVHEKCLLHRAFSVFVFGSDGKMLLQKRASGKYHSGGLWTNACCGHPRPGERTEDAAARRLVEEMGFSCPLKEVFSFVYKTGFDNGLAEHEFDHVFFGRYDGKINPNPEEAEDFRYADVSELRKDIEKRPERYTFWFREIMKNNSDDAMKKFWRI